MCSCHCSCRRIRVIYYVFQRQRSLPRWSGRPFGLFLAPAYYGSSDSQCEAVGVTPSSSQYRPQTISGSSSPPIRSRPCPDLPRPPGRSAKGQSRRIGGIAGILPLHSTVGSYDVPRNTANQRVFGSVVTIDNETLPCVQVGASIGGDSPVVREISALPGPQGKLFYVS